MGPSDVLVQILSVYMRNTHLGKVDSLERKLPQAFPPVNITLRRASDTTTAKLGTDTVLVVCSARERVS